MCVCARAHTKRQRLRNSKRVHTLQNSIKSTKKAANVNSKIALSINIYWIEIPPDAYGKRISKSLKHFVFRSAAGNQGVDKYSLLYFKAISFFFVRKQKKWESIILIKCAKNVWTFFVLRVNEPRGQSKVNSVFDCEHSFFSLIFSESVRFFLLFWQQLGFVDNTHRCFVPSLFIGT